jgi:polyvinyl alcohol dehydrogenase (cytochrome)
MVLAIALIALAIAGIASATSAAEPTWTTYHRDPGRSGNDPESTEPVAPAKAWQSPDLGAPIWGQPLVLGARVYVATVGDVVYALSASTGEIVWQKSVGTPVPSAKLPCGDISPTVGIVGTPVIDTATHAIYAVADTWNATTEEARHVLKGLGLAAGEQVLSKSVDPPKEQPKVLLQRTALNLDGERVVFGFGGNDGDCGEYRGAVAAVPLNGTAPSFWQYQPAAPAISGAGVWGASGPAVDGEGHVYAATGNPNTPVGEAVTYDYSDSLLKLTPAMSLLGNFEPPSWSSDSNNDHDLGSAGPELLPGGYVFQAGKHGAGYLFAGASFGAAAAAVYQHQTCAGAKSFGGFAFASGVIYIPCTNGVQALRFEPGPPAKFTPLWQGPAEAVGPPIVSAGRVWSVATGSGTKLYGLEPSTGAARYTLTLPSPVADHFASPSAAGGRLFLATGQTVTAYQVAHLAPEPPAITGVSPSKGPVAGGTTVTITGANFTGASAVAFGSTNAKSFTLVSSTSITAVSPARPAGVVDITVTAPGGTSALTPSDRFRFTPTVTKVTPASGPVAGGTSVTITGTGFAPGTSATTFRFGAAKATSVSCASRTSCTVLSPAHEAGTVDVEATVNGVTSPRNSPADQFRYG